MAPFRRPETPAIDSSHSPPSSSEAPILRSKLFWVGVLYFAEGFPLGVFFEVLPVHFRQRGVDLADIGLLSLLGLMWSIKFLWAPAVDHFRHHRRWMLSVDLGMAAILLLLAAYTDFGPWIWAVIGVFTLLSATNDIAIDGYTIEFLNKRELGIANGMRVALYRAGLLAAGLMLIASDWLGWSGAYALGAGLLVLLGLACRSAPPERPRPAGEKLDAGAELRSVLGAPGVFAPALLLVAGLLAAVAGTPLRVAGYEEAASYTPLVALAMIAAAVLAGLGLRRRGEAAASPADTAEGPVFGAFLAMSRRPFFLGVLLFILLFKLPDQFIGFMVKPFWVDAGFSATQIGTVSVNLGILLSIAGALAGGWFTDRVGIFHGLWILGLTQMVSNLGYAALGYLLPLPGEVVTQPLAHQAAMYTASAVESFTQGLGTGAFLAFLMAIVDKRHSATEYAVLSSVFALARSLAGWAGGYGAEAWGYGNFFLYSFLLGLPAYLLLPWVRRMLDYMARRDPGAPCAPQSA